MTPTEIAKAAGISRQTVYRYRDRLGRLPTVDEAKAMADHPRYGGRRDTGIRACAERFGISERTILARKKELGRLPETLEEARHPAGRPKKSESPGA